MSFSCRWLIAIAVGVLAGCGDDSANAGGAAAGGSGGSPAAGNGAGGELGNGGSSDGGAGVGGSAGGPGLGGGLPGGPSSSRLNLRPIGTVADAPLGFAEYLPPGYGDGAARPLLLFHHGIGESGDGSEAQLGAVLNTGLPAFIANDQWPESQPFIILSSQHDAPPFQSCHSVSEIADFMAFAVSAYDVDPKRVYITGLSCGAIGSWDYLGVHTNEVVAAAVLIAGNGNGAFGQAGCSLGAVPIWALHGDSDSVVNVSGSVTPIENLNACTNPPPVEAKLTLYPGVDHNSWDMTYDPNGPNDIYGWLLGYEHP